MDWLNDLPAVKGIDKVVAEIAQTLMKGPYVFRSPFWDGDMKIENLDDYRAWVGTTERIKNERGTEGRALDLWAMEKNRKY